jgi:hypothetical protein
MTSRGVQKRLPRCLPPRLLRSSLLHTYIMFVSDILSV